MKLLGGPFMIELNQLAQLIAIANYGTLSKASEELHLSQPALSRSMQKLEANLNVTLFSRTKNKIALNPVDEIAVTYAKKIMSDVDSMTKTLQDYEKSLRTLTIGSCAPGPLWSLTSHMMRLFPNMTITTEMDEPDTIINKLYNNLYDIIITTSPIHDSQILSKKYCDEVLSITLPISHALANKKDGIFLRELDGETMLLYTEIGLWENLVNTKMTKTTFIRQNERLAFQELIKASTLPSFTTNLTSEPNDILNNRIILPILDEDAKITFYCSVKKENKRFLEGIMN